MNHRLRPTSAHSIKDANGIVAGVTDDGFAFSVSNEFFDNRRLVLLAGRHREEERFAIRRCDGVNFR